jgi:MarR family transcriptional regulator, temperature-dependent positive regulator of motility
MLEQSLPPSDALVAAETAFTLELMRLLEQHPEYSQRELSAALRVSVGKTHYLLRALVDKGMVKAKNFRRSNNKLGYLYVLTPSGVRQRWTLTRAFLARKESEFVNLKAQITALRNEVAAAGHPVSEAASTHPRHPNR